MPRIGKSGRARTSTGTAPGGTGNIPVTGTTPVGGTIPNTGTTPLVDTGTAPVVTADVVRSTPTLVSSAPAAAAATGAEATAITAGTLAYTGAGNPASPALAAVLLLLTGLGTLTLRRRH